MVWFWTVRLLGLAFECRILGLLLGFGFKEEVGIEERLEGLG